MSLTRFFIYDLDGTLLDSRDAVRRAYAEVGVTMPDDAWGRPWQTWCGVEPHSRKVVVYDRMLKAGEVSTFPSLDVVREQLARNEHVGILTGASHEAVRAFIRLHDIHGVALLGWSMTRPQKKHVLHSLRYNGNTPHITYIDDEDTASIVPSTGRFVRYTGQTASKLKEDIAWM